MFRCTNIMLGKHVAMSIGFQYKIKTMDKNIMSMKKTKLYV